MTRIEELSAMKGPQLIALADELGVKVKCNRKKMQLVEAKAALIERIIAFEAAQEVEEPETQAEEIQEPEVEEVETTEEEENTDEQPKAEEVIPPTPKRGQPIEWNGKTQNICAWAEELGISANTLYGRLYKLGWTVEKAFTTKGRR